MVAKRTARAQRTQTINQARALIITGPDDIHTRFTGPGNDRTTAPVAGVHRTLMTGWGNVASAVICGVFPTF